MNAPSPALVLLAAASAHAGLITYSWDINDTGSNTATIAPGQTVNLKMYADWEPYGEAVGFAHTTFDIVGIEGWDTGTITLYDNKLDALSGEGEIQADNDILRIDAFQLPPLFNPQYWFGHPVYLYEIEWVPDDDTPRTVRLTDTGHPVNTIYLDDFGGSVEYDPTPSAGATIHIVPAPAPPLLLVGALTRKCRRR